MSDSNNSSEEDLDVLKNMAYHSRYTEDINLRMRVPQTITVIPTDNGLDPVDPDKNMFPKLPMQVPDRIVCSVGERGTEYTQGELPIVSDSQYVASEDVPLRPPPRVLTVQHQDSNLPERENGDNKDQHNMLNECNVSIPIDTYDNSLINHSKFGNIEDVEDNSLLRRQIYKMHQRLSYLEQQEALRLTRDYWVYGVAAAVLVFNGFTWLTQRR